MYEGSSFGIQYGSSLRSTPARASGDDKIVQQLIKQDMVVTQIQMQ